MPTRSCWTHATGLPLKSASLRNRRRRDQAPTGDIAPTPPYVTVTGSLTPDVTGIYTPAGTYSGETIYSNIGTGYNLWWTTWFLGGVTRLTLTVGSAAGPIWQKFNITAPYPDTPLGPWGGATGTATITLVT